MDTLKTLQLKEQNSLERQPFKDKTVELLNKHLENINNRKSQYTLEEAVFELMGGHLYIDNLRIYKSVVVDVLSMLAKNAEIKEKIGYGTFSDLIKLLENVHQFTDVMNEHYFKVLLQKMDIETKDFSIEELIEVQKAVKQVENLEYHAIDYLC